MSLKLLAQRIREIVTALEEAPHEVVTEIHGRLCSLHEPAPGHLPQGEPSAPADSFKVHPMDTHEDANQEAQAVS